MYMSLEMALSTHGLEGCSMQWVLQQRRNRGFGNVHSFQNWKIKAVDKVKLLLLFLLLLIVIVRGIHPP